MSYIRKSFILIIYSIHSIFSLWVGFLWHHEIETTTHSTESSCEKQGTCCSSKMNSCMTICLSREYWIQNNKYLEIPQLEYSTQDEIYRIAQDHIPNQNDNKIHKEKIPIIKNKALVWITKIIV